MRLTVAQRDSASPSLWGAAADGGPRPSDLAGQGTVSLEWSFQTGVGVSGTGAVPGLCVSDHPHSSFPRTEEPIGVQGQGGPGQNVSDNQRPLPPKYTLCCCDAIF